MGIKKAITTLTASHTYAKMMDETVFSSNYQKTPHKGKKTPHKYKPPSNDKQDEEDLRYFRQMMGIDKIKQIKYPGTSQRRGTDENKINMVMNDGSVAEHI